MPWSYQLTFGEYGERNVEVGRERPAAQKSRKREATVVRVSRIEVIEVEDEDGGERVVVV